MRRIHLRKRRVTAAAALLLASSLEICGCDLNRDCEQIRRLPIMETGRLDFAGRCDICLSPEEMNSLTQAQRRLAVLPARTLLESGEAVGQAILGGEQPAFYKPVQNEVIRPQWAGSSAGVPGRPAGSLQPWPIPESVFFVYTETSAGSAAHQIPSATAFVVSVPRLDHRGRARFLVTARHVIDPEWAHCADGNPSALEVRLNRVNGGSAYLRITLEVNHARQFFTPADGTADIAVIPMDERVAPNIESYEFMGTPFRLLPTASELAAIRGNKLADGAPSAGREIVTASLRTHVASEDRDYPLSGAGMLSSTTAAPVEIRCGADSGLTTLKLWTIDASVPREVSGAPVYTMMIRGTGNTESPVLLGVQSIAWPGRPLAGITPADALAELIEEALGRDGQQMDLYRGPLR